MDGTVVGTDKRGPNGGVMFNGGAVTGTANGVAITDAAGDASTVAAAAACCCCCAVNAAFIRASILANDGRLLSGFESTLMTVLPALSVPLRPLLPLDELLVSVVSRGNNKRSCAAFNVSSAPVMGR